MDRRRLILALFCFGVAVAVIVETYVENSARLDTSPAAAETDGEPARGPARSPASTTTKAKAAPQTPSNDTSSSSEPGGAAEEETFKGIVAALKKTEACYSNDKCNFPNTDPRSYDLAVGTEISRLVAKLRKQKQFGQGGDDDAVLSVATHFLMNPNGHVKSQALDLLADLPPSEAALRALLNGIFKDHDSELLPKALEELSRYNEPQYRQMIDTVFAEVLASGSHFVAMRLAESLLPFLNQGNIQFYQNLLVSLAATNPVRNNLAIQIQTFLKRSSGS